MRGTVRVGPDALAADNTFNFVVSPAEPVRVRSSTAAAPSAGSVSGAGAGGRRGAAFETVTRQPTRVRRRPAAQRGDRAERRRRASRARRGGCSVRRAGRRPVRRARAARQLAAGRRPLPRRCGSRSTARAATPARVGALEYAHPVFEPFRAPRSGNFSTVRVYGYRKVTPAVGAQVLARFDGGGARGARAARRQRPRAALGVGARHVLERPAAQAASILPFIHQSMRHLAAYTEPRPWLNVGQVLDPPVAAVARGRTRPPRGADAVRQAGCRSRTRGPRSWS